MGCWGRQGDLKEVNIITSDHLKDITYNSTVELKLKLESRICFAGIYRIMKQSVANLRRAHLRVEIHSKVLKYH